MGSPPSTTSSGTGKRYAKKDSAAGKNMFLAHDLFHTQRFLAKDIVSAIDGVKTDQAMDVNGKYPWPCRLT